jgi:hypothetical protein
VSQRLPLGDSPSEGICVDKKRWRIGSLKGWEGGDWGVRKWHSLSLSELGHAGKRVGWASALSTRRFVVHTMALRSPHGKTGDRTSSAAMSTR